MSDTVNVPREPTRAMSVAGGNVLKPHLDEPLSNLSLASGVYRAMLAAAPSEDNDRRDAVWHEDETGRWRWVKLYVDVDEAAIDAAIAESK